MLRSLEENGIKLVLKAKQKKAIERFYGKQIFLAVLPTGYGKSPIHQLLICFLADGLNTFPQALATDLSYLTFSFTWQTLQTSLQLLSFWTAFWTGFFSLFPTSNGLQIFKIYFAKQQKQEIRERIGAYRFCHERSGVILIG